MTLINFKIAVAFIFMIAAILFCYLTTKGIDWYYRFQYVWIAFWVIFGMKPFVKRYFRQSDEFRSKHFDAIAYFLLIEGYLIMADAIYCCYRYLSEIDTPVFIIRQQIIDDILANNIGIHIALLLGTFIYIFFVKAYQKSQK